METKTFDCVEMKHRGAEAIQKQLAGKTPEEALAFWKRRTEALRARQQHQQSHPEHTP